MQHFAFCFVKDYFVWSVPQLTSQSLTVLSRKEMPSSCRPIISITWHMVCVDHASLGLISRPCSNQHRLGNFTTIVNQGKHKGWLVSLVSWCFELSQPHRITSGLNTNFTVSPNYSSHKSSYHKSCFLSLFIFHGHSKWEPACSRVTYFILRAYTGTDVSHS